MPYRSRPEELTENPCRAAIIEIVSGEPGITFLELRRRVSGYPSLEATGNGNLVWHLQRLERAGLVSSHRSGRCRRYYPPSGPWHADLRTHAFVQSPARWTLASIVFQAPGVTVSELLARLPADGRTLTALRMQLNLLVGAGLVEARRAGRTKFYHPTLRLQTLVARTARESPSWSSRSPGMLGIPQAVVG